ncbi:hypothetical protein EBS02_06585, partial [bacterium]|nr:hypothetical protein [bacterium]
MDKESTYFPLELFILIDQFVKEIEFDKMGNLLYNNIFLRIREVFSWLNPDTLDAKKTAIDYFIPSLRKTLFVVGALASIVLSYFLLAVVQSLLSFMVMIALFTAASGVILSAAAFGIYAYNSINSLFYIMGDAEIDCKAIEDQVLAWIHRFDSLSLTIKTATDIFSSFDKDSVVSLYIKSEQYVKALSSYDLTLISAGDFSEDIESNLTGNLFDEILKRNKKIPATVFDDLFGAMREEIHKKHGENKVFISTLFDQKCSKHNILEVLNDQGVNDVDSFMLQQKELRKLAHLIEKILPIEKQADSFKEYILLALEHRGLIILRDRYEFDHYLAQPDGQLELITNDRHQLAESFVGVRKEAFKKIKSFLSQEAGMVGCDNGVIQHNLDELRKIFFKCVREEKEPIIT